MAVYRLKNEIQKYAWGSKTAIPDLLGYPNPENEPMAELWMGAHLKAPSSVVLDSGRTALLNEFIAKDPPGVLGPTTAERFGGRLPFLFKVLAAESPLSIQAHPNLKQAAEGFRRENERGVPIDAFNRNYRDDNHKPEIICALTEYHAMRGFRPLKEIIENFRHVAIKPLETPLGRLKYAELPAEARTALREFFTVIMELGEGDRTALIKKALGAGYEQNTARWIKRFSELYPGDIGILSPLYLNIVTLQPGEAMYLPAGELHAYLEGLGIELMANSDNVLRGGLTPKHVDVQELLSVLIFEPGRPEILRAGPVADNETAFVTDAAEFCLSRIELSGTEWTVSPEAPALPSIFICIEGEAMVRDETGSSLELPRGGSFFAEYGSELAVSGRAVLYRASVNER